MDTAPVPTILYKTVTYAESKGKNYHCSLEGQSNLHDPNPLGNRLKVSDRGYKIILINMLKAINRKSR